jgi:hypothetical protein
MDIFITWSGARSEALATALRFWLPKVIQAVRPWMSQEDIRAGAQWLHEITNRLNSTRFGIACVTPENRQEPWLLFEAGALAKIEARPQPEGGLSQPRARVCTLLLDMEPSDLGQPLVQFQAKRANRHGIRDLLTSINDELGDDRRPDLDDLFETWWPKLEPQIKGIAPVQGSPKPRPEREMLEELLGLARQQDRFTEKAAELIQLLIRRDTDPLRNLAAPLTSLSRYEGPQPSLRERLLTPSDLSAAARIVSSLSLSEVASKAGWSEKAVTAPKGADQPKDRS